MIFDRKSLRYLTVNIDDPLSVQCAPALKNMSRISLAIYTVKFQAAGNLFLDAYLVDTRYQL